MKKEDILEEYFLEEIEKTEEIVGWKVVGNINNCCSDFPSSIVLELKTGSDGWLCEFRIKLLGCGLVLCSPEYIIEENDLVLEAVEKIWGSEAPVLKLNDIINVTKTNIKPSWWRWAETTGDYPNPTITYTTYASNKAAAFDDLTVSSTSNSYALNKAAEFDDNLTVNSTSNFQGCVNS